MVKRLSQIYGKEKQKDLHREYYKLQNKIQELSVKSANGFQINNEYFLEMKAQLENIEKYKCKGAILRSKSQWALESDRNTAHFLKLEKYRQNKNVISEIKDCNGKIVTETNALLDVIHDYYEHSFSCVSVDMHSFNNVNVKIDDDDDVEKCDDVINIQEIEKSLKGKDISDTVAIFREIMNLVEMYDIECYLLKLDQEKAFDRAGHELKNFVKQGCPISALLYVWLAEPLSIAIKKNCEIKGVVIPNTNVEEKMFVHADNTTLTLVDKNSVSETFQNFYGIINLLVAYDVIINKIIDGGLNIPDIMQKMYAFRLKYLSILFDENYCAIWKQTCLYFFSKFENMNLRIELLFCDLRNRKIDVLPEFYQSIILSWQKICKNVDIEVNSENVVDIPLFLNPNITNCNKILYLKTFNEAGVCKIQDIAYECKPSFLKESYIQEIVLQKFLEVSESKILHAVTNVLRTIPEEYKVLVEANVHVSKTPVLNPMIKDGVQICSLPSTTSVFYQMLVSKLSREPKSVSR
ncbi:unnamed protein product [Mytilus coruscus]|uniref:Reverse transcriptase domain-containing protein n=1 Tax=Mytilus coruscus TaxID=42192 RepID=A0A6J8C2L5_MYTCO|nr:unnamed protein product [Mytilus coruscus]